VVEAEVPTRVSLTTSPPKPKGEMMQVPSSSTPIGGRLGLFQGAWATVEIDSDLVFTVAEGCTIFGKDLLWCIIFPGKGPEDKTVLSTLVS
jgi:hypothetical protein